MPIDKVGIKIYNCCSFMRKILLLSFLLILPLNNAFGLFQQVQGIESAQIKRTVVSVFDPSIVYAASKKSLYKSQDKGETFKKVAVFMDEEVQHIFPDPYLADTLYVATARHLYKVTENVQKIFSSQDEAPILTAAKHKGIIYVGTREGLYYSREDVLKWSKMKGLTSGVSVYYIEPYGKKIFLATSKGVYSIGKNKKAKRVFTIRASEEEPLVPTALFADIFYEDTIYLGTNRGLYFSTDSGNSWRKLYIEGVDSLWINCIYQTSLENGSLYLGTTKGFFKVSLKNKKSKHIFEGLYSSEINWIEFYSKGKIYLSTSKGLFTTEYFTSSYVRNDLEEFLEYEPSIGEIQEAALRYNDVHPDKIKRWRRLVEKKAILPQFSIGLDRNVTDLYHWEGGSTTRVDDDFLRKGREAIEWDVSLTWDLGDLIWNDSQIGIDTRARLNTQLRLDVLDEINRVYFERVRLKYEIVSSSSSEGELFSKKLRLQELTAILDGYTGGCLSKRLK